MTADAAKKVGRPSKFNETLSEKIIALAAEGKTNKEIADFVGISEKTLSNWKRDNQEFLLSLKEAKDAADDLVEASLFHRAVGYSHPAVMALRNSDGSETLVDIEKHYPPDTTAAIFWLKNRRPESWRDVQNLEHSGRDGLPIRVQALTRSQIEGAVTKLIDGAVKEEEEPFE